MIDDKMLQLSSRSNIQTSLSSISSSSSLVVLLLLCICSIHHTSAMRSFRRFDMRGLTDFQSASHRLQRTATRQLSLQNRSVPGDRFGESLASLGDIDNDNHSEFAVISLDVLTNRPVLNIVRLSSSHNIQHLSTHPLPHPYHNPNTPQSWTDKFQQIFRRQKQHPQHSNSYHYSHHHNELKKIDYRCDVSLALVGHSSSPSSSSSSSNNNNNINKTITTVAIGIPCHDESGAVFVQSFNENTQMLTTTYRPILIHDTLPHNARFGTSVAHVGDVDGDGYVDIIVGAPGDSSLYTVLLDKNAHMISYVRSHATRRVHDSFGMSITPVGDINNDGRMELLVSSNHHIHLISLTSVGHVNMTVTLKLPNAATHALARAPALSFVGLDDNDHIVFAIGNRFDNDGGAQKGAIWISTIDASGHVIRCVKISATQGNLDGHLQRGYHFGAALATALDMNKDGSAELLVGVPKINSKLKPPKSMKTQKPSTSKWITTQQQKQQQQQQQQEEMDIDGQQAGELWILDIPGTRSVRVTKLEQISPNTDCIYATDACTCSFRHHRKSTCLTLAQVRTNESFCYERFCASSFECDCRGTDLCRIEHVSTTVLQHDAEESGRLRDLRKTDPRLVRCTEVDTNITVLSVKR